MLSFGLVFFAVSLAVGVNADEGFIARLGFDPDILAITLVAFVLTGLVAHRHLALVVAVVLLVGGANVPVAVALELGYDPDVALAALFALVTVPFVARWMDG
ncbi:MAG: hypothetical protein H6977_08720 [Gammaproteobacteria bacterium]|nr:hypothetical protein [Gammaproteobacteria bacterium]